MSERTADYYQQHHSTGRYGFTILGDQRGAWFAQGVREAAKALGKSELQILDIGCRDGTLTKLYAQNHRVSGLDVDPEAVRLAKAAGIEAREHDMNRAPIPFGEAQFDVVVAGEVLEHLQWPQLVIDDIYKALRPGGFFFGSVPNAFRLRNRVLFFLGRDFEVDPTHLHWFSPESLKQLLKKFNAVEVEFHGGHRRHYHPRLMANTMHWRAQK